MIKKMLEKKPSNRAKKLKPTNGRGLRSQKKALTLQVQIQLNSTFPFKKNPGKYQVLDFFGGCGGMSSGFAAVNSIFPGSFEMLGACDINQDALNTYEKNFDAIGVQQDITKLRTKVEINNFLKNFDNYNPKKPLVLIGCPPCQGFTSHRKRNWDRRDPRNDLVGAFAELAVKLNPYCIIMENVPEMFSKKYGEYYIGAKEILEDAGYRVHQNIFNTAIFGVPQERFRMLVMAMKKDFILPEPLYERSDFLTVKDAIGDLPPVKAGERYVKDAYHMSANHRSSTIAVIQAVPSDGGSRPVGIGPKCLERVSGFADVYGRLSWKKPSITITQYARNPASGRFVHPEQDRGLTMREAARLQSFPDNFEFCGSFDSVFKQIGEAVPPMFACSVAMNALIEFKERRLPNSEKIKQNEYIKELVSNSYSSVIAGLKNSRGKKR